MEKNQLTTPDLYFASYLRIKGCKIIGMKKEGSKRIFSFDVSPSGLTVVDLRHGYFNNDDDPKFSVDALRYSDSIRSMKTLCHVETQGNDIITPDLYFAAYLYSLKCKIRDIKKSTYKTIFVFDTTTSGHSLQDLQYSYFNQNDPAFFIGVLNYNEAVKELKSQCQTI